MPLDESTVRVCERPVFIVGPPHGGTSLLHEALLEHPAFCAGPETDFLVALQGKLGEIHAFGCTNGTFHWLNRMDVSLEEFSRFVGLGVSALYSTNADRLRWMSPAPEYALHMEKVLTLLPDARFLNIRRDGRDVAHATRSGAPPVDHEEACRRWVHYTRSAITFQESHLGGCLHTVRYESLVDDPAHVLEGVFAFLEEPYEPRCADIIRGAAPSTSARGTKPGRTTPNWHGWTLDERRTFDEVAGALLVALGYEGDRRWVDG